MTISRKQLVTLVSLPFASNVTAQFTFPFIPAPVASPVAAVPTESKPVDTGGIDPSLVEKCYANLPAILQDLAAKMNPKSNYVTPKRTYTFWKCFETLPSGAILSPGCKCSISRKLTVPAPQTLFLEEGEYTNEKECDSRCGRRYGDACWACTQEAMAVGDSPTITMNSCMHVQDALPAYFPPEARVKQHQCFEQCNKLTLAECDSAV